MKSLACMLVILMYIGYRYTANAEVGDESTTSSVSTTSATGESDLAFIKIYIEKMDGKIDNFTVKVVELAEHINLSMGLVMKMDEKINNFSMKVVELAEHINFSMGLMIEKLDMKINEQTNNFSVKVVELANHINFNMGLIMENLNLKIDEQFESVSVKIMEHINLSSGSIMVKLNMTKADITEQVIEEHQLVAKVISDVCNRSCEKGSLRENTTMEEVEVMILNREDGSVNFTKNWAEYKSGFGNLEGEFWLGLKVLHLITIVKNYGLRVNFGDFEGNVYQSSYSSIVVGPETGGYTLSLSGYNCYGTGGDSLTNSVYINPHIINNMKFTTIDIDNDIRHINCAELMGGGGWWWNGCGIASPTGPYLTGGQLNSTGIQWYTAKNNRYSYKFMKLTLVKN